MSDISKVRVNGTEYDIKDSGGRSLIDAEAAARAADVADLKDDLEHIAPGLSAEAREALLACFRHVAFLDEDEDYYRTLEEALNFNIGLVSISASYESSGHTVYQFDTLESLRPYIVVTANYADGSTRTITGYALSGNLDSATSIITVSFSGKSTQISVSVVIDPTLLYYTPKGYVLDGTNDKIIDTGVAIASSDKTITVLFDMTDERVLQGTGTGTLLYNLENVSGGRAGYQFAMSTETSGNDYAKYYNLVVGGSSTTKTPAQSNTSHRVKGAIQHVAGSGKFSCTLYVDGTTVFEENENYCTFRTTNLNAFIGGRSTGGFAWIGTINLFNIYSRKLTLSEIKELLEVA